MNLRGNAARCLACGILLLLAVMAAGAPQQQNSAIVGPPAPPPVAADPLRRTTPRGTVVGFLEAAQIGDVEKAREYLQPLHSRSPAEDERLVRELRELMDRAFTGLVGKITDLPEGTPQPGVSPDQERIGILALPGVQTDFLLVRVSDANYGKIWLISAATLAKVPALYDDLQVSSLESKLPSYLVEHELLGIQLWRWLVFFLLIPVVTAASWAILQLAGLLHALIRLARTRSFHWKFREDVSAPLLFLLAAILHGLAMNYVGLPLLSLHYYRLGLVVAAVVGITWLLLRWVSWAAQRLRLRAWQSGRRATSSLIPLGQGLLKIGLVFLAGLLILSVLGLNITTALAGLGIGGLAVAFAAQKTLENLLGGVSVLADEVIRVGDTYRMGSILGTVEEIGLRSTRVRTADRMQVSIPNGALATMNVENLTLRDKMLFQNTFGLRYETTAEQLRYVLAEMRKMLYGHSKVETEGARVRFIGFGASSVDVEVFCYLETNDFSQFLAIREDLLLRIMKIVSEAGSSFALPSHTLYMSRDAGLDIAKQQAAEEQVAEWRKQKELPFPDFSQVEIAKTRGTVAYPESESAIWPKKS